MLSRALVYIFWLEHVDVSMWRTIWTRHYFKHGWEKTCEKVKHGEFVIEKRSPNAYLVAWDEPWTLCFGIYCIFWDFADALPLSI